MPKRTKPTAAQIWTQFVNTPEAIAAFAARHAKAEAVPADLRKDWRAIGAFLKSRGHDVRSLTSVEAVYDLFKRQVEVERIERSIQKHIDAKDGKVRSKSGRKTDPATAKIVNTIQAERAKETPWKDIPAIVRRRHRGKMLSVETLKDMVKPSKLLNSKSK